MKTIHLLRTSLSGSAPKIVRSYDTAELASNDIALLKSAGQTPELEEVEHVTGAPAEKRGRKPKSAPSTPGR